MSEYVVIVIIMHLIIKDVGAAQTKLIYIIVLQTQQQAISIRPSKIHISNKRTIDYHF